MRWSIGRNGFAGMLPRNIRESAFSVIDANLSHGDLRPFLCPQEVCDLGDGADVSTIVENDICPCVTFRERTSFVKDGDIFYWNDETGEPVLSTKEQFCRGDGCSFSVQCPSAPPNIVSFNEGEASSSTASCPTHFFAYRYSYIVEVAGREFEGHWSLPTGAILATANPDTVLDNIPNPGGCHTKVRLYRAASGFHPGEKLSIDEIGGWFCVGTFPLGATYRDVYDYATMQRIDPVSPDEYGAPPPSLRSLGMTDNGVMFGIVGRELLYTLPGYPMSWSDRRRLTIPENAGTPLLAVARGEDVYVYTDGKPVFLKGTVSQAGIGFDLHVVQKNLPLVSKASVTSGYLGEYFASTDGYYLWLGTQVDNLTIDWMNKDSWNKLDPLSISGAFVEDKLVWSSSVDAFMLVSGDRISQLQVQRPGGNVLVSLNMKDTLPGATGHVATRNNTLLYHKGGKVYEWDLCSNLTAAHHTEKDAPPEECCPWVYSDIVDADRIGNLTRGEVKLDLTTLKKGVSITFGAIRCGEKEVLKELVIKDCKPFTLPGCTHAEVYFFEASGCARVEHFSFAGSLFQLIDDPYPRGSVELNERRRK